MTSASERRKVVEWIEQAVSAGARRTRACKEVGMSIRTLHVVA